MFKATKQLFQARASVMTAFKIDIVSDPICPFCYLGKKRFERAIDVYRKTVPGGADDYFNITWKPFYLDPTLPQGKSFPIQERMAQKFGTERLNAMSERLRLMGQSEGICFTFQGKVGNTRDAHRLSQLAKTKGGDTQSKLMAELMHRYFEEGGDITSHEMLVEAAQKVGLDGTEAKVWLEQGKGGKEVDEAVQWAYTNGIQGVPHFTINDKYEIGGAQDVEAFVGELVRAKEAA